VAVSPISQPSLNKRAHRFPTGIYMLPNSGSGNDPGGLGLCLRLRSTQSHKFGDTSARNWIASGIKFQSPGCLATACEVTFHFYPSLSSIPTLETTATDAQSDGDVVAFAGGTFQARRDTARVPGEKDWACLATAGRSLAICGTYNGDIDYRCLDVAMINGSSFIALKDSPGACPGDDWQLLCSRGSRGERGLKGERGFIGPRGERAPIIKSWQIDRATYSAIPILADGSAGPALELRPLFEQFLSEREASGI